VPVPSPRIHKGTAAMTKGHNPRVWNARKKSAPLTVVYVGRGTPWGNPFVMGRDGDRDEVCDRFEREVLPTLDVTPLVGHDLLCWCAPLRCHADALLRKANTASEESSHDERS
jgi:hypothetical protein